MLLKLFKAQIFFNRLGFFRDTRTSIERPTDRLIEAKAIRNGNIGESLDCIKCSDI
jgi:hypothetical protein